VANNDNGALNGLDAAITRRSRIRVPKEKIKDSDTPVKEKSAAVMANASSVSESSGSGVSNAVKQQLNAPGGSTTTTDTKVPTPSSTTTQMSQFMTIRQRMKRSVLKRFEAQTEALLKPKSQTVGLSSDNTTDAAVTEQVRAMLYGISASQADTAVEAKNAQDRHKETMRTTRAQATAIDQIRQFTLTTTARFMEKSLALQYRQVLIAKDTLDVSRALAEIIETKLEAIKINTSVPEVKKRSMVDVAKETLVRNATSKVMGKLADPYAERVSEFLQSKVAAPLEEKIKAAYGSDLGKAMRGRVRATASTVATGARTAANIAEISTRGIRQSANEKLLKLLTPTDRTPTLGGLSFVTFGSSGTVEGVGSGDGGEVTDTSRRTTIVRKIQAIFNRGRDRIKTRFFRIMTSGSEFVVTFEAPAFVNSNGNTTMVVHGSLGMFRDPAGLVSSVVRQGAQFTVSHGLTMSMSAMEALQASVSSFSTNDTTQPPVVGDAGLPTAVVAAQSAAPSVPGAPGATAGGSPSTPAAASAIPTISGMLEHRLPPGASVQAAMPYQAQSAQYAGSNRVPTYIPNQAAQDALQVTQPATIDITPITSGLSDIHTLLSEWRAEQHMSQAELLDAVRNIRITASQDGGGVQTDDPQGGSQGAPRQAPRGGMLGGLRRLGGAANTLFGTPARGIWAATKAVGRVYTGAAKLGLSAAAGTVGFLTGKRARNPFCDIYRKGEITLGSPLVTERQLQRGLVLADNTPIRNVNQIIEPVIEPSTGRTLISREDVVHGLVDRDGNPISKRKSRMNMIDATLGLGKFGIRTAGGVAKAGIGLAKPLMNMYSTLFKTAIGGIASIGSFVSKGVIGILSGKAPGALMKGLGGIASSITGMYGNMFGLGIKGVLGAGKLLSGGIRNLFGFGGRGGGITKRDLKDIVGDRLDDIYELLDVRLSEPSSRIAGDTNDDGIRDGSYQDRLRQLAERRTARGQADSALPGGGTTQRGGLMGALMGLSGALRGGGRDQQEQRPSEEEGGDSGGLMSTLVGTYLASKIPGFRAVKGALGRGVGKLTRFLPWRRAAGAAAGVAGAAATAAAGGAARAGASAAAPLVVRGAGRIVGRSLIKKIPIIGALAGLLFSAGRLMDGDFLGAGAEVLSGLVSILPVFGTAASIAIDGWLGYRDMTRLSDSQAKLVKSRMDAYGIEDKKLYTATTELEKRTYDILFNNGNKMDVKDFQSYAEKFGFDPKDQKQVEYFAAWYKNRFVRVFSTYVSSLAEYGKKYPEQEALTDDEAQQVGTKFDASVAPIVSKLGKVMPTTECYKQIMASNDPAKSQQTTATDKQPAMVTPPTTTPPAPTASTPTPPPEPLTTTASNTTAQQALPGNAGANQWMNQNVGGGVPPIVQAAATTGVVGGAAAAALPSPANTNITVSNQIPAGGGLGSLSAHYESGKRGSSAVGYDLKGGTSYGKYQISSSTMPKFVSWLKAQGGQAAQVANRLANAGPFNTMSTSGGVPTEWKKIVDEGLMGNYEHEFIKKTHFDPVVNALKPSLQDRIAKSKALQDVVWSTAVQHGQNAAKIITSVGDDRLDDAALIRSIYMARSTQFGGSEPGVRNSVMRRLGDEQKKAIAMVAAEKAQAATASNDNGAPKDESITTQASSSSSSPAATTTTASTPTQPSAAAGAAAPSAPNIPNMSAPVQPTVAGAQAGPSAPAPVAAITASVDAQREAATQKRVISAPIPTPALTLPTAQQPGGPPDPTMKDLVAAVRENSALTKEQVRIQAEQVKQAQQAPATSTTNSTSTTQQSTANTTTINAPVVNNQTNVAQNSNSSGGFDTSKPRRERYTG